MVQFELSLALMVPETVKFTIIIVKSFPTLSRRAVTSSSLRCPGERCPRAV